MRKLTLRKKTPKAKALPARITNDTVAAHREKVLAGGRRHKYPRQYTKHKLVWNTLILSGVGLALLCVMVWVQLYVWRSTGDVMYRVVRILPLPVASVDGYGVRYSDYLLYHRSTLAGLKFQGRAESDMPADQAAFHREQAMDRAVQAAYVEQLARQLGVVVGRERVDEFVAGLRNERKMSEKAYAASIKEQLNLSIDEWHRVIYLALLRQDVMFAYDDQAKQVAAEVQSRLSQGSSLRDIAGELGDAVQFVDAVTVPVANNDGGLTKAASAVSIGTVSGSVRTAAGENYYFIHRLPTDEPDAVQYAHLIVPVQALTKKLTELKEQQKIRHYISLQ